MNRLAKTIAVRQQTLDHIIQGRQRTCRRKVLEALARTLAIPAGWLMGHQIPLPWARQRIADRRQLIWASTADVLRHATEYRALRRRPGSTAEGQRALIRGGITGTLAILTGSHEWPRPPDAAELAWAADLRQALDRLLEVVNADKVGRRVWDEVLAPLDAYVEAHSPATTPQLPPALAQIAEYRLFDRCWRAWVRDARRQYPDFEPQIRNLEDAQKPPWPTWWLLQSAIETLLTPEAWRAQLLVVGGKGNTPTAAEWEAIVPTIARALNALLRPWFEGKAAPNLEALRKVAKLGAPMRRDQRHPGRP